MTHDDIRADMQAGTPKRIWAFAVDYCDFDNEDEYRLNVPFWQDTKPVYDATEYIRADLHAAQIAALEARVRDLEAENESLRADFSSLIFGALYGFKDAALEVSEDKP